jgi:separase
MLQSLRLWNRAVDALSRLNSPTPPSKPTTESNPFEVPSTKDPFNSGRSESSRSDQPPNRVSNGSRLVDNLEMRVAQGLLDTLFALCDAYFARGSAREAEYFAQQAHDFAGSLKALVMVGRALARKGEVLLHQAQLQEGNSTIMQAAEALQDIPSTDSADVWRLRGDYSQLCAQRAHAQKLYSEATGMLEELDRHFSSFSRLSFR